MISKTKYLLAPLTLLIFAGCNAEGVATPLADTGAKPSTCLGCHQGNMSFSGRDAQALAETIKAIRDGERAHPPLALDDDSDKAIEALAADLTAGK